MCRKAFVILPVLMTLLSAPVGAVPFTDGEIISFSQNTWGADPAAGPPASLVKDHFDSIYPSGLTVGIGNFILFTGGQGGSPALVFLPQTGPAAALNATLVDPISSSSGIFGGQVTGLIFNIDFSDAGYTLGSLGIPFGDLLLQDLTGSISGLNGDNLRQFLNVTEIALGGGNAGYSIADLSGLVMQVNAAFEGGFPDAFAQDHLALPSVVTPVPEPSSLIIALTAALGWSFAAVSGTAVVKRVWIVQRSRGVGQ